MIGIPRAAGPRRARLAALGYYAPEHTLTNRDIEDIIDTTDEWIVSRTGIRERRVVAPDQATSDLAIRAAINILESVALTADAIDVLIVPTCTPDHLFPSVAALTADAIGAYDAAAFDIQAACSGFIYGLAQAVAFVESGLAERVLVVGAEVFSRLINPDDRSTYVLFGDAAAGALVIADDDGGPSGFVGFELGADGGKGAPADHPGRGHQAPGLASLRCRRRIPADEWPRSVQVRDARDGGIVGAAARPPRDVDRRGGPLRTAPGQPADHRSRRRSAGHRPRAGHRQPRPLRQHVGCVDSALPSPRRATPGCCSPACWS